MMIELLLLFSSAIPLTQHAYEPSLYCSEYSTLPAWGGLFHCRFDPTILTSCGGFKQNVPSEIKQISSILLWILK